MTNTKTTAAYAPQLITRGRDGAALEEINLTPNEHLALKAHLAELRRPAATAENEEWRQRAATLDAEGRAALSGLLDLYGFGDIDGRVGTNWLGKFVFDLLARVAHGGAAEVVNDPSSVRERLEAEIESIKRDVRDCRDIVNKYPGILAEVNAEPGQSE